MFIILDQSKTCYDAPDIFSEFCETWEDLNTALKFYDRKENGTFTVLDTNDKILNGEYNCKEYSQKEILKLLDEKFPK